MRWPSSPPRGRMPRVRCNAPRPLHPPRPHTTFPPGRTGGDYVVKKPPVIRAQGWAAFSHWKHMPKSSLYIFSPCQFAMCCFRSLSCLKGRPHFGQVSRFSSWRRANSCSDTSCSDNSTEGGMCGLFGWPIRTIDVLLPSSQSINSPRLVPRTLLPSRLSFKGVTMSSTFVLRNPASRRNAE